MDDLHRSLDGPEHIPEFGQGVGQLNLNYNYQKENEAQTLDIENYSRNRQNSIYDQVPTRDVAHHVSSTRAAPKAKFLSRENSNEQFRTGGKRHGRNRNEMDYGNHPYQGTGSGDDVK